MHRRPVQQRPIADQLSSKEIVGGKGRVSCIDRVQRRVQCDDQQACIAGLFDGRNDRRRVRSGQQDTLGTVRDAGFDCCNLRFVVAIDLTRIAVERDAQLFRLGSGTFTHFHKERVGVGFGDQARRYAVATGKGGPRQGSQCNRSGCE